MKVKNIVFSGVMAAILGATSANAAAISVASQGYVDSKVKANADAIALKADASTVTALDATYKLADQGLQNAIDGKVAKADYDLKIKALEDADKATNEYVGTIPEDATARNIVAYVQEKTAGAATEGALTEVGGRVTLVEDSLKEGGDTANAIAAALKAGEDAQSDVDSLETVVTGKADKATTLSGYGITDAYTKTEIDNTVDTLATKTALESVKTTANAAATKETVNGINTRVTTLEGAGYQNAEQVSAAINSAVTADDGVVKTAIATATNDMATKTYVGEQDAATLASAKEYADGKASAAQTAAEATAASELQSAMQNIAAAYLAKPDACATTYCVLSVTGETVSWMPLTEPQASYYPEEE